MEKTFEDALSQFIAERVQELNKTGLPVSEQSEKRVYTIAEIQSILGIGRVAAYDLVKKGLFHSVRVGSSIRVSKRSFDAWLDNSKMEE